MPSGQELLALAKALYWRNDGSGAAKAYRAAVTFFEGEKSEEGVARATLGLAAVALHIDSDAETAHRLLEAALPILRRRNDRKYLARALADLSMASFILGGFTAAFRASDESAKLFEELGLFAPAGALLATVGIGHAIVRDWPAALEAMREAHRFLERDPNPRSVAWYFDSCFQIAAFRGNWDSSARLLGFVDEYRHRSDVPRLAGVRSEFTATLERLPRQLGRERYEELHAQGRTMSREEAQAEYERATAS